MQCFRGSQVSSNLIGFASAGRGNLSSRRNLRSAARGYVNPSKTKV